MVVFLEGRRKVFFIEGVLEVKVWRCEVCLGNCIF